MIERLSWLDALPGRESAGPLSPSLRDALVRLDRLLFELWGLGENMILAWSRVGRELRFLVARHYALIESFEPGAHTFVNGVLAGPKFVPNEELEAIGRTLGAPARVVAWTLAPGIDPEIVLVNALVTRYGVSLVRERAVVLLDAVGFSLHSPLEQVAMLNSLSYSVNSAYRQLLSSGVPINFARTTTGDGFYIWNRARTAEGNVALYKLMMLILADNALARRKAQRFPVPALRAAFHVGEHYEFYQVEALNPTTFGYIVGPVTIELSRMIEQALPGQILIGDFTVRAVEATSARTVSSDTMAFVEQTRASLDQLKGLAIAGDLVEEIRCYLTGERAPGGGFLVSRYSILDKHGRTHLVYNAKINIHPRDAQPIYLGIQHEVLHPNGGQAPIWPPA
jgi:hypothetical protein